MVGVCGEVALSLGRAERSGRAGPGTKAIIGMDGEVR